MAGQKLLDELLMLIAESEHYHSDHDVRALFAEFRGTLLKIRRRVQTAAKRYVVAVVGLTNVGKSTLLNALLGADLAPRRNGPCTAVPIEFSYGSTMTVAAHYGRGLNRVNWRCATAAEMHDRLRHLGAEGQTLDGHVATRVMVTLPNPLLADGLILADTPGFGAAQAATSEGSHEQSLKAYLQEHVSQVFLVVLAEQGIGQRELRFHDEFFAEVCDDVIVTGCEDWDQPDCERFRRRFQTKFGQRGVRFHFVSGLQGLRARESQDASGLEAAGITRLEQRIRELATPAARTTVIGQQLRQMTENLGAWLTDYRDTGDRPLNPWWRPDSWSRFCTVAATDALGKAILNNLERSR